MNDSRDLFASLLHPELHNQRNPFPLDHRKIFTLKAGELLPCLCEEMLPQDYFEISVASLLRTFPLNTAAFLRARLCFDFFFVPYTAVWSRYQDFISQRTDKRSSYTRGSQYEPNVSIDFLHNCVQLGGSTERLNPIDSMDARTKVLNLLGYGYIGGHYYNDWPRQNSNKSLTALPIAGYNFIYNQYYRNAWRDEPNDYDIQNQNLDFVPCDTYANSLVDNYVEYDFVQMHYHQWFKDLFTGSLPSQQFGNISTISVAVVGNTNSRNLTTSSDSNRWSRPEGEFVDSAVYVYAEGGSLRNGPISEGNKIVHDHTFNLDLRNLAIGNGYFDVVTLRKAMALQKWKEYNMRAGWKNSPQQKAQYGSGIPIDVEHDLQFLNSFESVVQIDEVISMANTSSPTTPSNGNLGEIAGKGIGFNSTDTVKFTAPVPGMLYCIAYVLPQADYDAVGFDKMLMRSEPFDHFIPAFENTGLVPITLQEVNAQYGLNIPNVSNIVIGYAPYGYEYKTKIDKNYGAFMDWLLVDQSSESQVPRQQSGSLSPWVSNRTNFLDGVVVDGSIRTEAFYVSPSCLDHIFVKMADEYKESDQFMINANFDIKTVRGMSKLGLPTI